MENLPLRIALISKDPESRSIYPEWLSGREDILLEVYESVREFRQSSQGKHYAGFLIDMITLITSPTSDKEFMYVLVKIFPVLFVGGSSSNIFSGRVEVVHSSDQDEKQQLEEFLDHECRRQPQQGVRLHQRKQLFINTKVRFSESEEWLKTNLWNISAGGCYVLSILDKRPGEDVWLSFQDIPNFTTIHGEIRWIKPWGEQTAMLPGFGVAFNDLTQEQQNGILELVK